MAASVSPARNNPSVSHAIDAMTVVRQTDHWVALSKPAGVLSVPGKRAGGEINAAAWVRERYPHADGPITVHRLDMATSGLLLCALNAPAQRALSIAFQSRRVAKRYVAAVEGCVPDDHGRIDLPLRLDIDRRPWQVVDPVFGKLAQTNYRVLHRRKGWSLLELSPVTGRSHQLRVHCALGLERDPAAPVQAPPLARHAILGDSFYGDPEPPHTSPPSWLPPACPGESGRLLLHATWLAFTDPATGEPVELHDPAPFGRED